MKTFEEYVEEGIVRKISPDPNRAKNLKLEAQRKYELLLVNSKKLGINDTNANDFVEYCYNIIMFLIRAKLFEEGYTSSGQGAHEAEVAYTQKIGFLEAQIRFLDELRYFRNGILYYGKRFDAEYAQKVIEFTKKIFSFLKNKN
jgi:hypothetical protein